MTVFTVYQKDTFSGKCRTTHTMSSVMELYKHLTNEKAFHEWVWWNQSKVNDTLRLKGLTQLMNMVEGSEITIGCGLNNLIVFKVNCLAEQTQPSQA